MGTPTERRKEHPYRIVWRDDPDVGLGYHVYAMLGPFAKWILAPLLNLADKSQWRRISDRAFAHEVDAWDCLEHYCAQHDDWHGVGYARSMRAATITDTGPFAYDPWLVHFAYEPPWVYELYR